VVTPDSFPDEPTLFLVQGAVSPDGRSLAYVRYAPGATSIFVTAMAGSRPVALTDGAVGRRDDGPVWSPDGRWILFRRGNSLLRALASGGTAATLVGDDIVDPSIRTEGTVAQWTPDGATVIYQATDGLRNRPVGGGAPRLVSREQPLLWDLSADGRVIYAILERDRRNLDLVTIDVATGAVRALRPLGRKPVTPDYNGYSDTVRAMRLSPDGTRLMYAVLNPDADIWILDGFTPPARPWWKWW
jgi:hypothetical protein